MFLQLGMNKPEVKQAKLALEKQGFFHGKIDQIFDQELYAAVEDFQLKSGLNLDHVIGPKTWKKLGLEPVEPQPVMGVPSGRQAVEDMFGDPLQSGWSKDMLAFCETPPELDHVFKYIDKKTGKHGFYCHKLLVEKFQAVYKGIVNAKLTAELKSFDGCWNVRKIRGGTFLSMHSYGIAVDHNSDENPLGAKPKMDERIVAIFENVGFFWGGHFRSRLDGMHFQYAINA